ncbi:MAG: DUF2306 domain-containing protein [Bacteroidetes bacterium]|nr:DUF2306 domain-containing protein [Bacteroidota bacterium]
MDILHKYWLTSNTIVGTIHFISAIVGLILGLGILFLKPGSKIHKQAGYIFIPVLITVNLSALFIHQMGKTFGPFHILIPFSLYALFMGVRPLYTKMERVRKLKYHIRGMLAAALGLWAAFCAELVARTPILRELLFAFGDNTFLISTIEGFLFVGLFIFIINRLKKRQYKRIGLDDK